MTTSNFNFQNDLHLPEIIDELKKISWRKVIEKYKNPSFIRSIWQTSSTLFLYAASWVAMYWSLHISYALTLLFSVLSAGLLVRIFIIFHDCGHQSFFRSRAANDFLGFVTGILTFTPYHQWRHEHKIHHASSGNLDRRGMGDIWTLTVKEYQNSSWWQRFSYRFYRNPIVLLIIGPIYVFLFSQRIAKGPTTLERLSTHLTNLCLLGVLYLSHHTIGISAYLMIQLPTIMFASILGVWLFYVQHQFEGSYWERAEQWDYVRAAIQGSSFYKLPKILQWFSGSIGFHHIHHLNPRIPNYYLERCHQENPVFHKVKPLTLWSSFKSLKYFLWDEEKRKLVSYRHFKKFLKDRGISSPFNFKHTEASQKQENSDLPPV
jgi:omega-6 fatty acid desaturase (delta-12 desaturase)